MNKLIYAAIAALILGTINGYYWSRQGYRGWGLYFIGTIAFFGLIATVLKAME